MPCFDGLPLSCRCTERFLKAARLAVHSRTLIINGKCPPTTAKPPSPPLSQTPSGIPARYCSRASAPPDSSGSRRAASSSSVVAQRGLPWRACWPAPESVPCASSTAITLSPATSSASRSSTNQTPSSPCPKPPRRRAISPVSTPILWWNPPSRTWFRPTRKRSSRAPISSSTLPTTSRPATSSTISP